MKLRIYKQSIEVEQLLAELQEIRHDVMFRRITSKDWLNKYIEIKNQLNLLDYDTRNF